jgi:glycolate oxidase iron-sulfur subunit
MDSPRGRIYLMKLASEGEIQLDKVFVEHMDNCLGCMACMTACPSGVKYDKLIEATRAQVERNCKRPVVQGLLLRMIFHVFPNRKRLRRLLLPMRIYQRSGLQNLVRKSGVLKLLPKSLRAMEGLMPAKLPAQHSPLPEHVAAEGTARLKVGVLTGCVQSVFFPEVNAATVRVLASEGCNVFIPQEQGCCGALMVHAGEQNRALDYARRIIDVFEPEAVDIIVTNAAGCGSNLKDYGYLLRDDPHYADRARNFSTKCRDVSEVLASLPPLAPRQPLTVRVAYHDACHLQHAQSVKLQPRAVLGTIPGLEILEVSEPALCCGSAGIYNLTRPGPAEELGERKVRHILATTPRIVVTGNPGCILHLQSGLKAAGSDLPVVHLVQILDASIRGLSPEFLLPK